MAPTVRRRRRGPVRGVVVALIATGLVAAGAAPAPAALQPARIVDGPDAAIVDVGGAAIADDGTGGIVYRRRVAGVPHVYVARLYGGRWSRPERIDVGQDYLSDWPRIAAGTGGLLRVVWTQEAGQNADQLWGATAGPGPSGFGPPSLIDRNVGEMSATWPTLASNAGGQTYVIYRASGSSALGGALPPGYLPGDVRLARLRGPRWESLGILDRNPAGGFRNPDRGSAPRVGVDVNGAAIAAWQEPDDAFVDRIWARRVFSTGVGIVLAASPSSVGGAPVRANARTFDLAVAGFGEGTVVSQIADPAPGAPSQTFVNSLPTSISEKATDFSGARAVGSPGPAGGALRAAAVPGAWAATWLAGGAVQLATGDDTASAPVVRADDASGEPGQPAVAAGLPAVQVAAWPLRRADGVGVQVAAFTAAGDPARAVVSAPVGGPVEDLDVASSGFGDALVTFRQGPSDGPEIAAALVDAPPQPFNVATPIGWVGAAKARISWERAVDAFGPVTYTPYVDGQPLPSRTALTALPLAGRLGDGVHEVRVVATDGRGQRSTSDPVDLRVDSTPPEALVRTAGRAVRVRIADGPRHRVSGTSAASASVRFGDGSLARGRSRPSHRYRRPGRYTITIRARDRAGNRLVLRRTVRVR